MLLVVTLGVVWWTANRPLKSGPTTPSAGTPAMTDSPTTQRPVGPGKSQLPEPAVVLKAQRFVLVDAKGRSRGVFDVEPDGSPVLGLSDKAGTPRATLAIAASEEDRPALVLHQEDGHPSFYAHVERRGGGPGIFLYTDGANPRKGRSLMIGIAPGGKPSLGFLEETNIPRANLMLGESPGLNLSDRRGKIRVVTVLHDGVPTCAILNEKGDFMDRLRNK